MVSLKNIQASNSQIAQTLAAGLVAVFVGATSGIGETSLREFARHSLEPRIYFIGRSQNAGDRLIAELTTLNPGGNYIFVKADTSRLKTVDDVCKSLRDKENAINILYLSQGSLNIGVDSDDGIPYIQALTYYSRARFIVNLLPLLQRSTSIRRVDTIFAAGTEGKVFEDDFECRRISISNARGHAATMMTLMLKAISKQAPTVSFIHNFPGSLDTNLIRSDYPFMMQVIKYVFKVQLLFTSMPFRECGERHTFLCTSSKYPAASDDLSSTQGVPLPEGLQIARGIDGKLGSGVYSVDRHGDEVPSKAQKLIAQYVQDGMVEKLWKHTESEFIRITGSAAI